MSAHQNKKHQSDSQLNYLQNFPARSRNRVERPPRHGARPDVTRGEERKEIMKDVVIGEYDVAIELL
ncbi:hypothetical protein FMEAI12_6110013 [Parafrankia sp. Ea1.12]|nr:hypothetical protein FMEAI12_6110013 [Parafrankia sp. Ea1.12]